MTLDQVIETLCALANPDKAAFKQAKFNIVATNALGIYIKDLNILAKSIGKDRDLALALFETGLYDARILCSKILKHKDVTPTLMEH